MSKESTENKRAIIGVAGHVNHGKTTLIKAVTGMDTVKAQEKMCGITLDLGFAFFDDDSGNTIGVIDMPGHERYIRNMVAGVWGLDLVLLVVSANEGWMPMSTNHLNIAYSMGVRNIILCISKSDTVDTKTLELVEEEALEKCMEMTGDIPDSMCVSADTGSNIAALRDMISGRFQAVERTSFIQRSHLYIDRVFTVNGIGTVVTGSLIGGGLKIGDKLKLYPSGKSVQIRTLQSYHKNIIEAYPSTRVALGLKGISRKEVKKGDCLSVADAGCLVSNQLFVRLNIVPRILIKKRKNREVEIAVGTWSGLAKLEYKGGTRLARLTLTVPIPVFWGQSLAIIRHGGCELIHSGQIVWFNDIDTHLRKRLHELLSALPETLGVIDQIKLSLDLYGYASASHIDEIQWNESYVLINGWILSKLFYQSMRHQLCDLLGSEDRVALTLAELRTRLNVAPLILDCLLKSLKSEGKVRMSKDAWIAGAGASEDDLGADARALLKLIRQADRFGFEADKAKISGLQKSLRNLARLDLIKGLEGRIYYTTEVYKCIVIDVLKGYKLGVRFSIPEVKMRTGLSRKYMIPVLNRMELDGWVRRVDNDRIVLKVLTNEVIAA